ncbi:MAG: regulatory protein RecX [Saprospiraceae bacterium]|nr:RecX family transcriptional regulator [Saprospiraceae bacterium]MCB9345102.1 RecX family transcriptional regulator [Lewinellaceae bacterium]
MYSKRKKGLVPQKLTPDQLLIRLQQYCAYRERCPKEIRSKLKDLGADTEIARQIMQVLEGDNFFNEKRFALAYAGGKFRVNNWGKVRIRLELKMREIDPDLIEEALDSIEMEDYEATLSKLIERKLSQYANDPKAREKSAASLIRAGFEPALVFKML